MPMDRNWPEQPRPKMATNAKTLLPKKGSKTIDILRGQVAVDPEVQWSSSSKPAKAKTRRVRRARVC